MSFLSSVLRSGLGCVLSLIAVQSACAAAPAATGSASSTPGSSLQMLLLPALLIGVFYFLLIRPQSRRAKEQRLLLSKVAVGDEVMTAGGVLGRVAALRDLYVVLQIAKEVEITVQKSSIVTLLPKGTLEA